MVLLTTTQAAKAAIDDYVALHADDENNDRLERLGKVSLDGPVEHADLIAISKSARNGRNTDRALPLQACRMEALLKGATIHRPPPPPKPEPVSHQPPYERYT